MFQWPVNRPEVCAAQSDQAVTFNDTGFQWPVNRPEVCAQTVIGIQGESVAFQWPVNRPEVCAAELVAKVKLLQAVSMACESA